MDPPLVSVVIPVWNGRSLLEPCLSALGAQSYPRIEIIAVDNASTDGSAHLIEARHREVRLLRSDRNLGFAGACNLGIDAAGGEIVVLLNQDAVADREWLHFLVEALAEPKVGVVGCKVLYPDGCTIQSAGCSVHWPLGTVVARGHLEPDGPKWDEPCTVDYAHGCCMAFRRQICDRLGALDESFWPGYFEDADFCLRVRQSGLECRYEPRARLTHRESASFRRWSSIWRFHHRGRIQFVLKHTPLNEFRSRFVPAERVYQPVAAALVGGATLARAYLEAGARFRAARRTADRVPDSETMSVLENLHQLANATGDTAPGFSPPSTESIHQVGVEDLTGILQQCQADLVASLRRQPPKLHTRDLQAELDELEGRIEQYLLTIHARGQEIGALKEILGAREAELLSFKGLLPAREEELGSIKKSLVAREGELDELERRIEQLLVIIQARDQELGAVKEVLGAREDELLSFKKLLPDREEELDSIKTLLGAREGELLSFKELLPAREEELDSIKTVLAAREVEISNLEGTVSAAEGENRSLQIRLRRQAEEIAAYRRRLLCRVDSWLRRAFERS
jgi:GT2 family glycosyltransferase